jgi:hypothetical protein
MFLLNSRLHGNDDWGDAKALNSRLRVNDGILRAAGLADGIRRPYGQFIGTSH